MYKIMKKIFLILIAGMLIINCSFSVFAQEKQDVNIILDGYSINFDVDPIIIDGRTLVPFRAIAEALNVLVSWNDDTKTVIAANEEVQIILNIGSNEVYKNGGIILLDVAPQIVDSRTLIPVRFFSEAFNCDVKWDGVTNTVKITSPVKEMSVLAYYALGDSNTSSWTDLFGATYPNHNIGNTDKVSSLELGWYSVDSNGNLLTKSTTGWQRPEGWEIVVEKARVYHLETEMVVHVTDGDKTITNLLSSDAAIDNIAKAIANEAVLYQGVNLDFEGLGMSQKGDELTAVQMQFTKLVKKLRTTLGATKTLTLSLHALNSSYKGYDYKALGLVADKIVIMAYDYGTKPEPESLVVQAIEQALVDVAKEKLILGISIPNETPESIRTKIGLAKRYGLDGIALWRLGLIEDISWKVMKDIIIAEK